MRRIVFSCALTLALAGVLSIFGCASASGPAAFELQPAEQSQFEAPQEQANSKAQAHSVESGHEAASSGNTEQEDSMASTEIRLEVNGRTFAATLEENSSAEAFIDLFADDPLVVSMSDYANMEKVGVLPKTLPRNDEQISVGPGDIILYQGNQIAVYYGTNSWNFTRLGKIQGVDTEELRNVLEDGSVDIAFSLA